MSTVRFWPQTRSYAELEGCDPQATTYDFKATIEYQSVTSGVRREVAGIGARSELDKES